MEEQDKAAASLLPNHTDKTTRWAGFFGRWRVTVSIGASTVALVLIANWMALVWCLKSFENVNSTATVFSGLCGSSKRIVLWTELAVNTLSTLLLSASNVCAQLLTSPTRKEIDISHARRQWMEIGIPNLSNLSGVSGWRSTLWVVLTLSSVPLHLLYNSVVFSTTMLSDYQVAVVTESFASGGPWDAARLLKSANYSMGPDLSTPETWDKDNNRWVNHTEKAYAGFEFQTTGIDRLKALQTASNLTRLTPGECANRHKISDYQYNPTWRNMLVVTSLNLTDNVLDMRQLQPDQAYISQVLYKESRDWLCASFSPELINTTWSQGNFTACQKRLSNTSPWTIPQAKQCNSTWVHDLNTKTDGKVDLSSCTAFEAEVLYCLIDSLEPQCSVKVSFTLLGWVIFCNIAKLICMVSTIFAKSFDPLATVGDAIASFLSDPDHASTRLGPISKADLEKLEDRFRQRGYDHLHRTNCQNSQCPCCFSWNDSTVKTAALDTLSSQKLWQKSFELARPSPHFCGKKSARWIQAANFKPWLVCILFCAATTVIGLAMLLEGLRCSTYEDKSLPALWKLGLGTLSLDNLIHGSNTSLAANVVLANLPQIAISFVYLLYNRTLTNMVMAHEYSKFATMRKTLRVSKPQGAQRGTFWLQLPYRYIAPLMISTALLHWLVARSIFLVELNMLDYNGNEVPSRAMNAVGYSPMAILLAVCVGASLTIVMLGLSIRKLKPGIPVAGSCSLAIGAACHATGKEEDVTLLPLMYGATQNWDTRESDGMLVQRAGFSSKEVEPLSDGGMYV